MRAVVQRVRASRVEVDGEIVGSIELGLCVLLAAMQGDIDADAQFMARKLATLRIFGDDAGKMNRSVVEVGGSVLLVSQFTLAADTTSGTRPSFSRAMPSAEAKKMCGRIADLLRTRGLTVAEGIFGAEMQVHLQNDGPVTIWLDSRDKR